MCNSVVDPVLTLLFGNEDYTNMYCCDLQFSVDNCVTIDKLKYNTTIRDSAPIKIVMWH